MATESSPHDNDVPMTHGKPYSRGEKLVIAAIILFIVNAMMNITIELQVQARNQRLDRLETTITQVDEAQNRLSEEVTVIREIAESVTQPNPEQDAAIQQLYQQIQAIYDALVASGDIPIIP